MAKVIDVTGQRVGRLIDVDEAKRRIVEFGAGCHPEVLTVETIVKILDKTPTVVAVPVDGEFGLILNFAVRYACGRRTYAPSSVVNFITHLIPHLDDVTLANFDKDLTEAQYAGGYGDPNIDEPAWREFHALVRQERRRRVGISD